MFRENNIQQFTFNNPIFSLPKYLRKNLEKSELTSHKLDFYV